MNPRDPNAILVCPVPARLLQEVDALAREKGCDRAALIVVLLGEALRVRTLHQAVESSMGASVIAFPRPHWAVDPEGAGDA